MEVAAEEGKGSLLTSGGWLLSGLGRPSIGMEKEVIVVG